MVKVIVFGINGKMGRAVIEAGKAYTGIEFVAGIDKFGTNDGPIPTFPSLCECNVNADVIIDFSRPDSLTDILSYALKNKTALVLCTTGYSVEDLARIEEASKEVAIFRSSNMSLGVNVLCYLARSAAKLLSGYDVEIVEAHHRFKVDAPSGTALMLADEINSALGGHMTYSTDRNGKRTDNEIGIQSIRGGNVVGEHDVMFIGSEETVTLSHHAASRSVFAKGSLDAALFIAGKTPGVYNMNDLISEKGI